MELETQLGGILYIKLTPKSYLVLVFNKFLNIRPENIKFSAQSVNKLTVLWADLFYC